MKYIYSYIIVLWVLNACSCSNEVQGPIGISELPDEPIDEESAEEKPQITDEELLDFTQRETFKYFWNFAEANSGAARERYHPDDATRDQNVVTTGGTGFGLMALLIGIDRGFVTREQGVKRLTKILSFLETADRFHGVWPHWINGSSGSTIPFSEKDNGGDLVETAFLVQGLICVKEYLQDGNSQEQDLAAKADSLWKEVEWDWYTQNQETLYWHWSPNFGFDINLKLKGYNEVLITYVLGAASPDYSITKETYTNGWASNGNMLSSSSQYGFPLIVKHAGNIVYGGPLFWAHYSYLGLNPNNLVDGFVNYSEVNTNHSRINYQYCIENPNDFKAYGKDCWGLTASYSRDNNGDITYRAHQPGNNDVGVISPTAALGSMPYTPEESIRALRYFYSHKDKLLGPAGFYDAFSPEHDFWVAEAYLAIDQGPIIVMIENHRTGMLWNLFMKNKEVQAGLAKLGFSF